MNEKVIQENNSLYYWESKLRVFKEGYKNTPLEIHFTSKNEYTTGNSLTSHHENNVNLNRPFYVRKLIEYALNNDWNGEIKGLIIKDGISILEQLGFDMSEVKRIK